MYMIYIGYYIILLHACKALCTSYILYRTIVVPIYYVELLHLLQYAVRIIIIQYNIFYNHNSVSVNNIAKSLDGSAGVARRLCWWRWRRWRR